MIVSDNFTKERDHLSRCIIDLDTACSNIERLSDGALATKNQVNDLYFMITKARTYVKQALSLLPGSDNIRDEYTQEDVHTNQFISLRQNLDLKIRQVEARTLSCYNDGRIKYEDFLNTLDWAQFWE